MKHSNHKHTVCDFENFVNVYTVCYRADVCTRVYAD